MYSIMLCASIAKLLVVVFIMVSFFEAKRKGEISDGGDVNIALYNDKNRACFRRLGCRVLKRNVIPSQRARWRGNLPDIPETYGDCHVTPCGVPRNDRFFTSAVPGL